MWGARLAFLRCQGVLSSQVGPSTNQTRHSSKNRALQLPTAPFLSAPLQCVRRQPRGSAPLRALSDSLRRVLAECFSVGLLQLRRLTWEGTPAALLEKVRF